MGANRLAADRSGSEAGSVPISKGLSFPRRRDKGKASKELCCIFDILKGISEIYGLTSDDFEELARSHPVWFKKFSNSL